MINKTWLKISCFIPVSGTIINIVLLFIQYVRKREAVIKKNLRLCMFVCAFAYVISRILITTLTLFFLKQWNAADTDWPIVDGLGFVLGGLFMNFVFLRFYKKKIMLPWGETQRRIGLLNDLLSKYHAALLSFQYDEKAFGNMMAVIKQNGKTHTFIADRGEMCMDNKMICNSSYHIPGKDDAWDKFLEMIITALQT